MASTSILVAALYWSGDRLQMERAVDLAADLLDAKAENVDLLFVGRFDAPYPSTEILAHVKEKFSSVRYWRCNRGGSGFPEGCSELAYGLFQYIQDQRQANDAYAEVGAVLILEADCVFTRKTWAGELSAEWDRAKAAGKLIAGQIQPGGRWGHDVEAHVNAVALYDADILTHLPVMKSGHPKIGWDYWHRKSTLPHAMNSKLFKLDWQKKTISAEELFSDPEVLVYHGVKSDDAIHAVRERFQLK